MINSKGLYVQADGGNGDSSHRTGLVLAISALLGRTNQPDQALKAILKHLEVSPGIYIRHPADYEGDWSANTNNFSRDQASRIILGMAVTEQKDVIKRWFKQMLSRGLFHQNNINPVTKEKRIPDIMAIGEFRNVIRGLDLWYLYPALLLLDLFFITDIWTRSAWDGASLFAVDIFYACKKYPTPFAFLARHIIKNNGTLEEILNNHSLENNGCVELQPLFKELYES